MNIKLMSLGVSKEEEEGEGRREEGEGRREEGGAEDGKYQMTFKHKVDVFRSQQGGGGRREEGEGRRQKGEGEGRRRDVSNGI
jgi:hypothetical protein